MDDCQCQACGNPGVDIFDICHVCWWENDFSLEDDDGRFHGVGFILSDDEKQWYSCANGSSPAEHMRDFREG